LREDYLSLAGEAGAAKLPWEQAKTAAEHAWNRVERGEALRIQLSEEQLKVGRREVEGGSVRLRKIVRTEAVSESVELYHDEATIDRVTTGNLGPKCRADAFQEGTIEVPLKREEAVVQKTAQVVGEVKLKKNVQIDTKTISETLRKEDVEIDSDGDAKITGPARFPTTRLWKARSTCRSSVRTPCRKDGDCCRRSAAEQNLRGRNRDDPRDRAQRRSPRRKRRRFARD
jgi:uncharacterized protein (TIGR02271 family)